MYKYSPPGNILYKLYTDITELCISKKIFAKRKLNKIQTVGRYAPY